MSDVASADPAKEGPLRRRGRLIIVVLLTVVVVGAVAAVLGVRQHEARQALELESRIEAVTGPVTELLDALAAGEDVTEGLDLMEAEGAESLDMPSEPISHVEVTPPSDVPEGAETAQVSARFLAGSVLVDRTFTVTDADGDGTYVVEDAVEVIETDELATRFEGLGLAIDGTPVTGEPLALLPGVYVLTTAADYVDVRGGDEIVAGTGAIDLSEIRPHLNSSGVAAVRNVVIGAIEDCLGTFTVEAGCGLSVTGTVVNGYEMTNQGIFRIHSQESAAAVNAMVPELQPDAPMIASAGPFGEVQYATIMGTAGGFETVYFDGPPLGSVTVDITDPDLPVIWD